jgi:hypothetical protein
MDKKVLLNCPQIARKTAVPNLITKWNSIKKLSIIVEGATVKV